MFVAFDIRVVVAVTGVVLMYFIVYFIVFWRKKSSEIRRGKAIHHFMVLSSFVVTPVTIRVASMLTIAFTKMYLCLDCSRS